LSFLTEAGRRLPVLTRFQGPIRVSVSGSRPAMSDADLDALLLRLRSEARIDIHRAPDGQAANIRILYLPRREMQAVVPDAACFVTPSVTSWAEYVRYKDDLRSDWTKLTSRQHLAVFIPDDTSPQEIRDCLNEELAQAVGPIDDLYRLPDSIFNDDNFNSVLTGFDMLMLRIYNDPALRNGMSRAEAAAVVPGLLARDNPAGDKPGRILHPAPRPWIRAVETATGNTGSSAERLRAANRAVRLAESYHWQDVRLAFSLFLRARYSAASDTVTSITSFARAQSLYRSLPSTGIHIAHIEVQMTAFALAANQPDVAIRLADRYIPVVERAQNAAVLSLFYMLKARAYELKQEPAKARPLWREALGWG
ncbi:DUF2927 domain-containing protein, partial [Thioclava sp. BHET1]